jgi:hypothetical protein
VKRTLQSELTELEKLITTAKPRAFDSVHRAIKNKVEVFKRSLTDEIESMRENQLLIRAVRQSQREITRLLDKAESIAMNKNRSHVAASIPSLENILMFIERKFSTYFDHDYQAPSAYIRILKEKLKDDIPVFENFFRTRNANPLLSALILRPLKYVYDSRPGDALSYRKLRFANELRNELARLHNPKYESQRIDDCLKQLTFYLNYNSGRVIQHFERQIQLMLEQIETRSEKIEKLSLLQKTINQAHTRVDIKYDPFTDSITSQLSVYIAEEMHYLDRVSQLTSHTEPIGAKEFSDFKLKFQMSVPQLAYLTKLFVDQKILLNSNVSQVLNFLSRFAITKHAETVSYSSIRAKFYNVESGTKKAVKNLLTDIIRQIDNERP